MAIKRNLPREQTEIRATLPEAYCKIEFVEIRVGKKNEVTINLLTFADAAARADPSAVSVNKEKVVVSLVRFTAVGQPVAFTDPEIKAAAYRLIKAEGWAGEDC